MLFEITPLDTTTFFAMPAIFALIAAVASYLPARRATRLDLQAVLQSESPAFIKPLSTPDSQFPT
ncbi:MAG TPA: hypothetical protein VFB99_20010, partial [Vicinamibacterales bacterium]|nr:hypothetical protein [Vicinamibacterales bacterium]